MFDNLNGQITQVAPRPNAISGRVLRYQYTEEIEETEKFGDYLGTKMNKTYINPSFKSEIWLSGSCDSTCPGNCTGSGAVKGHESRWTYTQKSLFPQADDLTIPDPSLRTLCKRKDTKILKFIRI